MVRIKFRVVGCTSNEQKVKVNSGGVAEETFQSRDSHDLILDLLLNQGNYGLT